MRFSAIEDVAKACGGCGTLMRLEDFPTAGRKGRPGDRKNRCAPCLTRQNQERYAANPEEFKRRARQYHARWLSKDPVALKKKARERHLERTYGLERGGEARMFQEQDGKCAICRKELAVPGPGKSRWDWCEVDHCHTTGSVRALLCGGCNRLLGHCGEDPARLRAAAEYLERHGADHA